MPRFVLTPLAKADLAEISQYIRSQGSLQAARRVGQKIRIAIEKLCDMPAMGHARTDLANEALRFWSVYSYLIVYRPNTKPLQIIRVLHGARDIESILQSQP